MKIFYINDETTPVTIRLIGNAPDYKDTVLLSCTKDQIADQS